MSPTSRDTRELYLLFLSLRMVSALFFLFFFFLYLVASGFIPQMLNLMLKVQCLNQDRIYMCKVRGLTS